MVEEHWEIDIEEGRRFWAFQPPQQPEPPEFQDADWPWTDVDRFLLAKMEQEGLHPVADSDPESLVRRLYFDLIGLPPAPEEVDRFVIMCAKFNVMEGGDAECNSDGGRDNDTILCTAADIAGHSSCISAGRRAFQHALARPESLLARCDSDDRGAAVNCMPQRRVPSRTDLRSDPGGCPLATVQIDQQSQ